MLRTPFGVLRSSVESSTHSMTFFPNRSSERLVSSRELPTSNQVLLKREGYRQIFSTFALVESSLGLQLDLDDAIHPSQRNVASLYEYWTFLKLAEVLGKACQDTRAPLKLFEKDGDGLSLGLIRGETVDARVGYLGCWTTAGSKPLLQPHVPTN